MKKILLPTAAVWLLVALHVWLIEGSEVRAVVPLGFTVVLFILGSLRWTEDYEEEDTPLARFALHFPTWNQLGILISLVLGAILYETTMTYFGWWIFANLIWVGVALSYAKKDLQEEAGVYIGPEHDVH